MGDAGPSGDGTTWLSVVRFEAPADGDARQLPVLYLHGSPGSARNWEDLGSRLARLGRDGYALDLPGFGQSSHDAPSYSILAHARAALAALDELGLARAHVVSWSMGGGVALHLADLAPERVASIVQIAAIGVQEAEGSGSFAFEHVKYALLGFCLWVLPEALPHFGWLGPYGRGRSFVRNFWDTDQRPLRGIMERLETPTLILQGRDDFLVPAWTAEVSHELIGPSRLVLLDASHFIPIGGEHGQVDRAVEHIAPFLDRHDSPGVAVERARLDLAPPPKGLERLGLAPYALPRSVPWWIPLALFALLAFAAPVLAPLAAGSLAAGLQLDFGVGAVAVCAGALARDLRAGERRPGRLALRVVGTALLALLGMGAGGILAALAAPSAPQWAAALGVAAVLVRAWRARLVVAPDDSDPAFPVPLEEPR